MARPAERRPLTRTSARRPCRCPCPRPTPSPLDRSHRQRQVAPFGPLLDVVDQHDQRRLAFPGPGTQVAGRGLAGPAGRAHQDDVDAGQQISRRFGPPTPRMGHEDHPAQVDAQLGRRHHSRIGQADRGTPAPGLRGCGQEGQGQRGGPVAGQPGDRGRGPPSQRPVGKERSQRSRHGQEPPGDGRGGADPVRQPDREFP
jgi:hypothetical protein